MNKKIFKEIIEAWKKEIIEAWKKEKRTNQYGLAHLSDRTIKVIEGELMTKPENTISEN